jgi:hypothetical protein
MAKTRIAKLEGRINDEIRMTKFENEMVMECMEYVFGNAGRITLLRSTPFVLRISDFVIDSSFEFRHSGFPLPAF